MSAECCRPAVIRLHKDYGATGRPPLQEIQALALGFGGNIERAVTRPCMFPNATPPSSRARARDVSYTVGSHKLTCVVHTALVRSLVVFANRDDGRRIVVTSIVSQFQRRSSRSRNTGL